MPTDSAMRRAPTQERSQATVERILRAADELVAEHGVHGFVLSDLPPLAKVTSGSVYQFFPGKDAILEELGRRYLEAFDEELDPILDELRRGYSSERMERLLATYVAQFRAHPGFRALWIGREQLPLLRESDRRHDDRVEAALRIALRDAGIDERLSEAAARLVVAVAGPMIDASLDEDGVGDESVLDEAGHMLRAYLAELIDRTGART